MAADNQYDWRDLREAAAECREALDRTGGNVIITDDRAPGPPER